MKKIVLIALSAFCLMICGCERIYGPVEEAKAYVNHKEDLLLQISKKLEASPDEAGAEEARKLFDAQKEGLKAEWKAIDDKPKALNVDWQKIVYNSAPTDNKILEDMIVKFGMACKGDCSAAMEKLYAIEREFVKMA